MSESYGVMASAINVPELTKKVRVEALDLMGLSQLATPPTGKDLGLGAGAECQFTYVPNLTATAGGALNENEVFPTSDLVPVKANYTVGEYGHGIAYTGKLDMLSRLDMEDMHMKALDNHRKSAENIAVYTQLASTDWKYVMQADLTDETAQDGTPPAVVNTNLTLANLRKISTYGRVNKFPYWDGESYVYVTDGNETNALESDNALTTILKEDSGRSALNGEIGRVARCRVVEDNDQSTSVIATYYDGFLVGADAVVREDALPWEIRFEVTDMGRSKVLGYYGLMSWFKLMDETTHSQEHIVHVTSAAS